MKRDTEIKGHRQALLESRRLKSVWSQESMLTQRTLIYIASLLEKLVKIKSRRNARTQRRGAKSAQFGTETQSPRPL